VWLLLASLAPSAHAFCGTYVASAGNDVYNSASEVAIVRQGTTTTLSVSNDVVGDPDAFAMLVPVPEVLDARDIHVLDPADFDLLRTYSMPRLVKYSCGEFAPTYSHPCPWMEVSCEDWFNDTITATSSSGTGSSGGTSGGGTGGGGVDVEVEAEYIVGEYLISVLSADESTSLLSWLDARGYAIDSDKADLLQEYIDAGSYFLAAEVHEDAGVEDGQMLSPLQLRYESNVFGLPIRIGTSSSQGSQDLIIYTLTEPSSGRVGIANYPEFAVEDECMWIQSDETFDEFYAERFTEGYDYEPGADWVTEYGWLLVWEQPKCDPCTGPPPETQEMANLGFRNNPDDPGFYFSRLHMRYTPDEATQDIVFYLSGLRNNTQARYILYFDQLEDRFPVCTEGWAPDPNTCVFVDPYADVECVDLDEWEKSCEGEGCGCTSSDRGAFVGLSMLSLFAALASRRTR